MHIYATLSDDNICIALLQTYKEMDKPNMIQVPKYDISYIGKKYENGEWATVEKAPIQKPLTDEQRAIYDTQSNVEYLVCMAELGM